MNLMTMISFWGYILGFAEGFLVYQILGHFARKRDGKFWSAAVFFSCSVISNMIIFPNDLFNVTLDLVLFLGMMLIAFQGSIWQKLAAAAVLYPLIISQNFLVMELLGHLDESFGRSAAIDTFCCIADPVLHLLIWSGIYRMFEKHLPNARKLFDDKIWMMLDIVCLASMVSITTCIYFSPRESYKMWPSAFACFATNLGCIALAEYFVNSIRQNMERKNLMLQKNYYEELEQNQNEIRRFRHDMNNHLSVIQSLFCSGDQDEAKQYLKEMETQLAVRSRVFCKNSIVNAVLNAKYNLAQERCIDTFFHIDLDKLAGIDVISLCSLFSNTLDNAVEACVKIPKEAQRYISVKARVTENGYFTYEIKNSKINAVARQKGRLRNAPHLLPSTNKEDAKNHGLGLANVQEMVEKYEGTLDISYTEDTFTVMVLIGNA